MACEYLDDLSPVWEIKGVRVPGLCRWLMSLGSAKEEDYGWSMVRLREVLLSGDLAETDEELAFLLALRENPQDDLNWNAYTDWLSERGGRAAGHHLLERALPHLTTKTSLGLDQVGDHVVQTFAAYREDDHDHWFFFDDLWGAAHPALADALLRYATRWDILSTGNESRQE
jgi:uncharacterized protein (TIGR02996 family)